MLFLVRLVFALVIFAVLSPFSSVSAQAEGYEIRIGVQNCMVDSDGNQLFCDPAHNATVLVQTISGEPIGSCVTEYVSFGEFGDSCQVFVPFSTEIVVTQDPASLREGYGPDVDSFTMVTADQPIGVDRPLDGILLNTRVFDPNYDAYAVWVGAYTCPANAGDQWTGCLPAADVGASVALIDGTVLGSCLTVVTRYEGGDFSFCSVDAPMGTVVIVSLDSSTIPAGYTANVTEFTITTPIRNEGGIRTSDVVFRLDALAQPEPTAIAPDPTATVPEPEPTVDQGSEEVPVIALPNTGSGGSTGSLTPWLLFNSVLILMVIACWRLTNHAKSS